MFIGKKKFTELSSRTHWEPKPITVTLRRIICRLQVSSWLQASNNTGILNTCTWLWLTESEQATPVDSIKGRSSKFCEGSRVRQTPEEGWRTYRAKRCGNNKDEDNSPKTLNDKNNLNVSFKLHPYSLQMTRSPPGPRLPKRIGNAHPRNYNLKGKDIDVHFL